MISGTVSHYLILSRIGAGGMGEVYLARDTSLDRHVALKFLPLQSVGDQHASKRLLREARAAAKLDHPNICSIHEVGEHDGQPFIVMQYVEGETLASRIARKPINLSEALDIAVQAANALAEAHSRGIIHRDVKPHNIMITPQGRVKVMDFGLAKVIEGITDMESAAETATLLSQPGAIAGTVPYMSPEQVKGETIDARSDIFSLGVVLYEMLTGQQPFASESAATTISAIIGREPMPLARYSREAPEALEWILAKALRKDQEERYQAARELATDLKNLKQQKELELGLELSMAPERSGASVSKSGLLVRGGNSNHRILIGAGAFIVVAMAVGIYLLNMTPVGGVIDSLAVLPLVNASEDPDSEYLSEGISESVINSLSQLPELRVMARTSAFQYRGKDVDPRRVGRELGVGAVLMGSIRQRGEFLTIQVDLVETNRGSQLWGEQYHNRMSDLVDVQQQISREIVERLRVRFSGVDAAKLGTRDSANPEAYQLYMRGRYYTNRRTPNEAQKGLEYFRQAIEKDPTYALAYSGMADAYIFVHLPSKEKWENSRAATMKALELDETLAEAHTSLGGIKVIFDWDWEGAERAFKRAIELDPHYPQARDWYSRYFLVTGRHDEAIAEIKRARELDPLSLIINGIVGFTYYIARQYDQAIEQSLKAMELDPNYPLPHRTLSATYEQKGMYDEAFQAYLKSDSGIPPEWIKAYSEAYRVSGWRGFLQKRLEFLKETQESGGLVSQATLAGLYAKTGEKDLAVDCLEKAYEDRDERMMFLKVSPDYDNLRSDPRFQDLLRRVGLGLNGF